MEPNDILRSALESVKKNLLQPRIDDAHIIERINYICHCLNNRAGVRLVLSCALAKIHKSEIDPRKPYTEIGSDDSFSGRWYDENFIAHFINENRLPCNPTTAFLTPALRNIDRPLTPDIEIIGRPRRLYQDAIRLLDDMFQNRASPEFVLEDIIRSLIQIREDNDIRIRSLLRSLKENEDAFPLSVEGIIVLIQQHLDCKGASRLPVLIVAAAYQAASERLKEKAFPIQSHNAADEQTGAIGDIEICLENDDKIVTVYEMKNKRILPDDIDRALQKIAEHDNRIDNYIFITTDPIDERVRDYAKSLYQKTYGIEIAILDCIGFLRHFLHLFTRLRITFLDIYQNLVLSDPDSAVSQPLKEAFLALRRSAESGESD
ncbi:MAG: restriction endonuclease, SacI family [Candidatus Omnitrophota bacterium]